MSNRWGVRRERMVVLCVCRSKQTQWFPRIYPIWTAGNPMVMTPPWAVRSP